jgi:hypothetical protein
MLLHAINCTQTPAEFDLGNQDWSRAASCQLLMLLSCQLGGGAAAKLANEITGALIGMRMPRRQNVWLQQCWWLAPCVKRKAACFNWHAGSSRVTWATMPMLPTRLGPAATRSQAQVS